MLPAIADGFLAPHLSWAHLENKLHSSSMMQEDQQNRYTGESGLNKKLDWIAHHLKLQVYDPDMSFWT
jgi:hypothetical protein